MKIRALNKSDLDAEVAVERELGEKIYGNGTEHHLALRAIRIGCQRRQIVLRGEERALQCTAHSFNSCTSWYNIPPLHAPRSALLLIV